MIADGCLKPRKNETPRERFERLDSVFNALIRETMDGACALPSQDAIKMQEKLIALGRVHKALLDENICKPRR